MGMALFARDCLPSLVFWNANKITISDSHFQIFTIIGPCSDIWAKPEMDGVANLSATC